MTIAQLPLLGAYRRSLPAQTQTKTPLILVTHVLPTSVPFIRVLANDFDLRAVVAIPYSTNANALASLDDLNVVTPPTTSALEADLRAIVEVQDKEDVPYVVQEIGGYLAPAISAGVSFPNLKGIVEDTRQGHWRYRDIADELSTPVLSVAESPLKALEHHQIGRAIVYSLERQIREHFYRSLSGESVAVLGFGDIGSAAAQALRGRDAHVVVHDVDPIRQASAWLQGFKVADLHSALAGSHLIVGCTGVRSLSSDAMEYAPDGAVFASGSSKQVEIDSDFFDGEDTEIHSGTLTMRMHNGKRYYLIDAGRPINFLDGSAIGSTLDLVYTELYACTREVAEQTMPVGLQGLSASRRRAIATMWVNIYAQPDVTAPSANSLVKI